MNHNNRRFKYLPVCLFLILGIGIGFIGGAIWMLPYRDFLYGAYNPDRLVQAIIDDEVKIGTSTDDMPLLKARAYNTRTLPDGGEEFTAIYQDTDHIVLVNAVNKKINRLVLWKYGYDHAEVFLEEDSPSP